MHQGIILPQSYYMTTDVVGLARDLLGKYLVSNIAGKYCRGMIVETEAYRGPDDRACHAFNHRRTNRTEIMFAPGGHAYVYICYGIHHLMNVVTGPKDHPHAILIRALAPDCGVEHMARRRNMSEENLRLTVGPGALSQALGITSEKNGIMLFSQTGPLWIEESGESIRTDQICAGPRIGVESAGDAAHWPWRFFIKHNPYVSARKTCP